MKRSIRGMHNDLARTSPTRMSIAALCLTFLVPAERVIAQSEMPALRRMQIHDGQAYMFDFDVPDAIGRIALLELSWEKGSRARGSKHYYVFGADLGIVTGRRYDHNRAWTITNDTLYLVVQRGRAPIRSAGFFRYPFYALTPGPGKCVDRAKLGLGTEDTLNIRAIQKTYGPPILPLTNALRGIEMDDDGNVRVLSVNPKVSFDITADAGAPQLYVSIDGRLSRHEFRNEAWRRLQNYSVPVHGEFLVVSNGTALITQIDDYWCVVSNLQSKGTTTRIAESSPGREMLVVEDVKENSTYFVFGTRIFDTSGAVRDELPIERNAQDHIRRVLESVLGYREKR